MVWTNLDIAPGIFKDDSGDAAKGRWSDGRDPRFVRGLPQTTMGFESVVLENVSGKARGLHTWQFSNGVTYIAVGTHTHLYVYKGGAYYDITPTDATGTLGTDPLTTTNGSAVVSVADTAHGRSVGDRVIFSGATAVGGITISGEYTVTAATDADNYTITHSAAATSGATGGGSSVAYTYLLPVGRADGTGAGGYGTGTYGTGTYGSNSVTAYYPRTWTFANVGDDLIACPRGGKIYRWQGNTSTRAAALTNAPTQNLSIFLDPAGRLVAWGSQEESGGAFRPTLARWCDQQDITDWSASATDQAGEFLIREGSAAVGAMAGKDGFNWLWTDSALIVQRDLGDPGLVYLHNTAGSGGLIGPLAATIAGGTAYWWGSDGQFYRSSGGPPEVIPCPVRDDVNSNLAAAQNDKIVAGVNASATEIVWYYADSRDGTEVSRNVRLNYQTGDWSVGERARTCWANRNVLPHPIAVSTSGRLYYEERGNSADGAALTTSIRSGYISLGAGGTVMEIHGFRPDFKGLQGSVQLYIYTKLRPQDAPVTNGPWTITSETTEVYPLCSGTLAAFEFVSSSSPSYWRLGKPQWDLIDTGEEP